MRDDFNEKSPDKERKLGGCKEGIQKNKNKKKLSSGRMN